ncbi:hypothetical protein LTR56_015923 [Elasticomyces elasticus]|nr:hypothetical protein LTR56_015923 [Elasticomyces elasticus]KAK3655320.1 hypothetical protein LTR22_010350 [Elasticomyces elasticus]KAK4918676.1 hypothetical protein LTR49_013601 [Elasticomyces elasticus]KAK5751968.1 hypothetical protein LTS12_017984 [Elasticomyces elasticus]
MATVTQVKTISNPTGQETTLVSSFAKTKVGTIQSDDKDDLSEPSLIDGLWIIPTFQDKYAERQWAKEHMAGAFRFLAKKGYIDGAGGHISLRDPVRQDCFWINPYSVHFGMLKASDMILVDEQGQAITQTEYKVNRAGFMIHAALHKARPDIHAAVHTHSPYGRAWSVFGRPVEMLNQGMELISSTTNGDQWYADMVHPDTDCCYFYNDLSVYDGYGGVVLGQEEGERIAQALGPRNKSVILQNHGYVFDHEHAYVREPNRRVTQSDLVHTRLMTCGGTVDEAVAYFHALEQACQAQILAESAAAKGCQKRLIHDAEASFTKEGVGNAAVMFSQFKPEYQMLLKETAGEFCE